jgi:hypothetical protein
MEPSGGPSIDDSGSVVAFSSRHPTDAADKKHDFDLYVVQTSTIAKKEGDGPFGPPPHALSALFVLRFFALRYERLLEDIPNRHLHAPLRAG